MKPHKIPKILVFSSADSERNKQINDNFIGTVNAKSDGDFVAEWHNYDDVLLKIETNSITPLLLPDTTPITSFDFVFFKSFARRNEVASTIAMALDAANVPFVCSEVRDALAITKLLQFAKLAQAGIPIVPTLFASTSRFAGLFEVIQADFGLPFIFKATGGKGGDDNFLITDQEKFNAVLASHGTLDFVAQPFVKNDSDLRVLIVDGRIQLVIKRSRGQSGNTHLNNTSQGAQADLLPLSELNPEHQALALRAAQVLHREFAGVDVMYETNTNRPYILEVNASPQVASGAFEMEKVAIFTEYFKKITSKY